MAKKRLIIVHGMGTHTTDSVKKEVSEAFKTVFSWYSSIKSDKPEDKFDLIPFEYDNYFEENRKAIEARGDLLAGLKALSGISELIADLQLFLTEDKFFNTHWLDVLLYRVTLYAEPIRLDLASKIIESIDAVGSANVHVMGHSLGTSVVHDTLAKLYGPEPMDTKLSTVSQKLGAVHQISNVSRLLQSFRKVGSSEVRPGTGCCTNFLEYRHKLDPFTKIKPFDPTDNGEWVSHKVWNSSYQLIEPTSVTSANVHNLDHYLKDPQVHLPLMRLLFGFRPLKAEQDAARASYLATTVSGKAMLLRDAFESFDFSEHSINTLLKAGKVFAETIESLGDSFK